MSLLYNMQDAVELLHVHLEHLSDTDERGIDWGFGALRDYLLPLMDGDLGFILGRPGSGKCLGRSTKVVMFDGTLKNVEDIKTGDLLMGPDSKPRKVLGVTTGRDQMYLIKQNKGIHYRVNSQHILSLKRNKSEGNLLHGETRNFVVEDVYARQTTVTNRWMGYKTAIEFSARDLILDPYFLGLWLGDGDNDNDKDDVEITTNDSEIIDYLFNFFADNGTDITTTTRITDSGERHICVVNTGCKDIDGSIPNDKTIQGKLKLLGVLNNKHIPQQYISNTRDNRLQLLAGLIDSEGYLIHSCGYEITQKSADLAGQIKFLADSLGFRTSIGHKIVKEGRTYYKITIYGDITVIPVKIKHKVCRSLNSRIDFSMTGFVIEKDNYDEYFGFELDGDGLFLLEDMTVTHNSALLTHLARRAAREYLADKKGVYGPPIYISNEMPIEELQLRQLAFYTNLDSRQIRFGKTQNDWIHLHEEVDNLLNDYPVTYIGASLYDKGEVRRMSIEHIVELIDKEVQSTGLRPRLVCLDYLQRISIQRNMLDKRLQIIEIVEICKNIALDYKIPVIVGSQASREVDTLKFPIPEAHNSKESGAAEESGDCVVSCMRPSKYYKIGEPVPYSDKNIIVTENLFFIKVLKQRSGEAGRGAWIEYDPRTGRFGDLVLN